MQHVATVLQALLAAEKLQDLFGQVKDCTTNVMGVPLLGRPSPGQSGGCKLAEGGSRPSCLLSAAEERARGVGKGAMCSCPGL